MPPTEESNARSHVADRWKALTREQKLSVGVLFVAGLIAFTMSVVRIRSAIINPFTTPVDLLVQLKKQFGPTDAELLEQQKKKDTDGDGISDWDELNKFHTSPYLRDSDSDGDADNIEIAKGTDPNCPKGKSCLSFTTGTESPTGTEPSIIPPTSLSNGLGTGALPPGPNTNSSPVPERTPAAIRAFLRSSGISEQELSNYSDADLLEAYDESAGSAAATSTAGTGPQAPEPPPAAQPPL